MAAIRKALKPDGMFLICDINSRGGPAANIAGHPQAALMYGFSVSVCMGSGLSDGGGLGLGTLGFPKEVGAVGLGGGQRGEQGRRAWWAFGPQQVGRKKSVCAACVRASSPLRLWPALPWQVAERMALAAGFSSLEQLDWESHMNSCGWPGWLHERSTCRTAPPRRRDLGAARERRGQPGAVGRIWPAAGAEGCGLQPCPCRASDPGGPPTPLPVSPSLQTTWCGRESSGLPALQPQA
jgi:hypothetical protein